MTDITINLQNKHVKLFEGKECTVGRIGYGADIELENPLVSRKHIVIKCDDGYLFVKDLSSRNGTFINSKRIKPNQWIKISVNDTIKVSTQVIKLNSKEISEQFENSEIKKIPSDQNATNKSRIKSSIKDDLIRKGHYLIGRSRTNDVIIDDPTVSRKHAEIIYKNDEFWIQDLGSKNKTYINGKKLTSLSKLRDSDTVVISFYSFNLLEGLSDLRKQQNAIRAIGIRKKYPNGKVGLQSLSVEIGNSSFVALMGPSGCGKSTLLKCLNGDNPATTGEVYIHGLSLEKNFKLIKKKIGYVPQEDIIHRELSVYDTLFYASKLRLPDDTSEREINDRIDQVIKNLNLDQGKNKNIRNTKVSSLSGGQRKRISIAVELLTQPTILFLDEPTSPLDPETIENFLESLKNLVENGTTIIMVTHKPEDLNYVDQVIFLGVEGHLTYKGPAKMLVNHFNSDNIVEVYGKMSKLEEVEKYYYKPNEFKYKTNNKYIIEREKPDSFLLQLLWLTLRYLKVKTLDKENLLLLIAQPFIIAGLVCLVFNQFRIGVIFLMAISAIWFGVSNAAKEIVGEISVYKRERMFNLNINTYIISKCIVLSIVAAVQSIIFVAIIHLSFKAMAVDEFPEIYPRSFFSSTIFMFFIAFSATLIGLLLSAFYSTTEKVMTVVPITLMPQIMLAGVMTKIDSVLVEVLSFFTLGRWGTEGLARIQDNAMKVQTSQLESILAPNPLQNEINHYGCGCNDISAMERLDLYNQNLVDEGKLIGSIFDSFQANIIVLLILNLIIYFLIYYSLKGKDSL